MGFLGEDGFSVFVTDLTLLVSAVVEGRSTVVVTVLTWDGVLIVFGTRFGGGLDWFEV